MQAEMERSTVAVGYPEDWRDTTLESVAEINSESLGTQTPTDFQFRYIDIASVAFGVIDWSNVKTHQFVTAPSRARRVVRPGDVLLSTVRPGLQAHAYADWNQQDGYVCSTGFAVLRGGRAIWPRFLYHLVFSGIVTSQVRRLEVGSNYPAITETDVRWLRVPQPPLPEQRRIAEILDTADRAIGETEALISKLQHMKTGLMHDLLTRGLDERGQLRDPDAHPEQFKETPLGRIPREWEIKPLGEAADIGAGVTLGRNLSGPNTVELPYLRVANVQDSYLDLSEIKTVRVLKAEVSRYALQSGDVLMNEGGDFDKLGRGTVWESQITPCLHQNHVFRVRTNQEILRPHFLAAVSGSTYGKRFFVLSSKQSTNLASINSTQLKAFPLPCPDLAEQDRILTVMQAYDARIRAEEAYRDKLKLQKKGLMDDLLTGRVRVKTAQEVGA